MITKKHLKLFADTIAILRVREEEGCEQLSIKDFEGYLVQDLKKICPRFDWSKWNNYIEKQIKKYHKKG